MKIGLDFYGTLEKWPNELGELAKTIIDSGGEVHIITACMAKQKMATEDKIRASGIPHTSVEWCIFSDQNQVPEMKLRACRKLGVTLHIDDLDFIINHLNANGVLALKISGQSLSRLL